MARVARTCEVIEGGDVCGQPHEARGMCRMHYLRWRRTNGVPVLPRPVFASPEEVFWSYAQPGMSPEDCWGWTGWVNGGYSEFKYMHRKYAAHVFACELLNGPRPDGKGALHKCGPNPWCVNPNHLAWGLHSENMSDRDADGTGPRGTRNGRAKLSEEEVLVIYRSTGSHASIARLYGIEPGTIRDIRIGKIWGWLTQP